MRKPKQVSHSIVLFRVASVKMVFMRAHRAESISFHLRLLNKHLINAFQYNLIIKHKNIRETLGLLK